MDNLELPFWIVVGLFVVDRIVKITMLLHQPTARLFVPDDLEPTVAFERVSHLGIGAHQDDLEFMAIHGIQACFHSRDDWFGGVTCTDGAGSSRTGPYAEYTDAEMQAVRLQEQEQAAVVGRYAAMAQLGYPSSVIMDPANLKPKEDLVQILRTARPKVIYAHNPADKHDTHIGVFASTLAALRELAPEYRPERLIGCEVWRGLDWMQDDEKVGLDVDGGDSLAAALGGIFDSQIAGGKRYDLAVEGRKQANATFFDSHSSDASQRVWYAMDLMPLVEDPELSVVDFTLGFVDRFRDDIRGKLERYQR